MASALVQLSDHPKENDFATKEADRVVRFEGKMKNPSHSRRRSPATPGPKPDMLKIDGDWKHAMKTSLEKKKPPEGWPK